MNVICGFRHVRSVRFKNIHFIRVEICCGLSKVIFPSGNYSSALRPSIVFVFLIMPGQNSDYFMKDIQLPAV
jgi:hypothetical protein